MQRINVDEPRSQNLSQSRMSSSNSSKVKGPMDKHVQMGMGHYHQTMVAGNEGKGVQVDQSTLNEHWKMGAREDASEYIARYFFDNAIVFNVAKSISFQQMIEAIGKYGPNMKAPTPHEISMHYLPKEVNRIKEKLSFYLDRCMSEGCSLMTDAWTDRKGRSIMNIVLHSYNGAIFYESKNTSSNVHDGKFIYEFVNEAIDKVGEDSVVQVVTDNASNNVAASILLSVTRPTIFWTWCAAHTVNLMLNDIGKIKPIHSAITMGRNITVFMYAHTLILENMRKNVTNGNDLVRPGMTRFATAFLSLESLQEHRKGLKYFVNGNFWEEHKHCKSTQAKKVKDIVNSRSFWKNVTFALAVFEPLVKVLRRADSDLPSMGWLYGDLERCKEEIALGIKKNERKYLPIHKIIDTRWDNKLKSYLHLVGHFLNPFFYYQIRGEIKNKVAFLDAFVQCIYKMYESDPEMQDNITSQLPLYQNRCGSFGRPMALRQMQNPSLDLVNWWQLHGCSAPDLQKMAMRIVGLTTSSSGCERNWSTFEMVHSKKRNRLLHDKMEKLVYVKFNSEIEAKFANRNRDPLLAPSMDEGRVVEWVDPPRTSVESETDNDDGDEVFPGEQLRWRDVEKAIGVDPRPRSSSRQRASKKAKRSHGASSSKGKRIVEEEDIELEPSLDSNDDTSTSESESEEDEGHEE